MSASEAAGAEGTTLGENKKQRASKNLKQDNVTDAFVSREKGNKALRCLRVLPGQSQDSGEFYIDQTPESPL